MTERLHLSEADRQSVAARVAVHGPVETILPLTPLQQSMLFHTVATDIPDLYAVQQRIEIDGPLDPAAFEAAWHLLTRRHQALRTLFTWRHDGPPLQVVLEELAPTYAYVDLSDRPDAAEQIEARFEADRRRPFELEAPPVARVDVFRTGPHTHTMLWSQHHLTIDGWSSSVMLEELFEAHDALAAGRDVDLPATRPFSAYMDWLEAQPDAEPFWRDHLAGFTEPTRMIAVRPDAEPGVHRKTRRTLDTATTDRLVDFARSRGLTPNIVLTGALAVVVGRHTARNDVAIGIVASGRPPELEGVERMVGMFINTNVARLVIEPGRPVGSWLDEVKHRLAAVVQHSHSGMLEVQGWSDLGAATTLTDTLFAHWGFAGDGHAPSGLSYRTVAGHGRTSFPFSVTVEAGERMAFTLDHDEGDYAPARAERFLDHLTMVLTGMLDDPDATVASLEMLGDSERAALEPFTSSDWERPHGSVVDAILAQAARTPDAVAVDDGSRRLTFAELGVASERLAAAIIEHGGFDAPRVAIHLPRSSELVVAMLAALRAGAAYVPLDRHLPPRRLASMLDDSGADLVIVSEETAANLPDDVVPAVLTLPLDDGEGGLDFDIPVGGSDLAYVMYTSGSTGRPKGVMVTHQGLASYVGWAADTYAAEGPASFPLYTSPGFDLTVTSIFVPLVTGGTIVVYPDDDVRDLSVLEVFEDDAVDVVKLTPSHLALLEDRHFKTERIRCLILGGEELRTEAVRPVHDLAGDRITIYNEYGPTEATVGCMIHRYDPAVDTEGAVPIGGPAAGSTIRVVAPDGSEVPPGEVGEIAIGGEALALGYLGQPELTAERFVTLPASSTRAYLSGDLARLVRPGVLEYLGRSDDQLKVRGHRIEPGEIEDALTAFDGIAAAAVALREPSPGDERLVAYYVPAPGASINVTEVRAHLSEHLPDHMVTRNLVAIDEIPLSPNGKVDRGALPDLVGDVISTNAFVPPSTAAEQLVARLAADLLGVEQVSVGDNFFDLGAHSILAMQLIARLHEETGVRISPRVVLLNSLQQAARLLPEVALEPVPGAAQEAGDRITTSAFFFGPADAPLFGMHTAPLDRTAQRRAVLLCPPIGWEYMRTHWTMRKVARRLALEGHHVLRFDYHGTGDSSGAADEPTVDRWVEDIRQATAELRHLSGASSVCLVGVRLGATLASLAATGDATVDQLVLWDPVVRGDAYLATLERMHGEMLSRRTTRVTDAMVSDELLGFPFGPERRRRLASIDLAALDWPDLPISILETRSGPDHAALAAAIGSTARIEEVDESADWDDFASTQSSLLVASIPDRIVRAVGGAR